MKRPAHCLPRARCLLRMTYLNPESTLYYFKGRASILPCPSPCARLRIERTSRAGDLCGRFSAMGPTRPLDEAPE